MTEQGQPLTVETVCRRYYGEYGVEL